MAALTADYVPSGYKPTYDNLNASYIGVVADDILYKFSLLSLDAAGDVKPRAAGDDTFAGVCGKGISNSGGSAGDVKAMVFPGPFVFKGIDLAGSTPDIGDPVYCETDNPADMTTTDPGSGVVIGKVLGRRAEGTDADYDVLLSSTFSGVLS